MVDVVKAGTAVTFAVTPGEGGYPLSAVSLGLSVLVDGSPTWTSIADISYEDALANGVSFPAEAITSTKTREFLVLAMHFKDADGNLLTNLYHELVVESDTLLRIAENSFGSWSELVLETYNIAGIDDYKSASKPEQIAALISAYYNIGKVQVDFNPPLKRRLEMYDQSLLRETGYAWASPFDGIRTTLKLTPALYAKLPPMDRIKLIRAQIVEADFILGGNPIERQRLNGLLSMGAGESTYFYRTSKPLELPICRKAAQELAGLITYAQRLG